MYKKDYTSETFINHLVETAKIYTKIASPSIDDWRLQTAKRLYFSLSAFNVFSVSINRPFILALFGAFSKKAISLADLIDALEKTEHFHFQFNAVCSLRPSGVESSYSVCSRKLLSSTSKPEARAAISELLEKLRNRKPSESDFVKSFSEILFLNSNTKQKKLVQYTLAKMERHARGNFELIPLELTIEHILEQASGHSYAGKIGNLLPLSEELNGKAGTKTISEKLPIYQKSNFVVTQKFAEINAGLTDWSKSNIVSRTNEIARDGYKYIWKI